MTKSFKLWIINHISTDLTQNQNLKSENASTGGYMKKYCKIIMLAISLIAINNFCMANNHTYKVYNQKLNKSFSVQLGTITLTENQYIFAFFLNNGQPYCVINLNTNIKNNLVGGQCTDYHSVMDILNNKKPTSVEYGWREYSTNTFYPEIHSLKHERALQGKYLLGE